MFKITYFELNIRCVIQLKDYADIYIISFFFKFIFYEEI